jgi:cell division protein FtsQ
MWDRPDALNAIARWLSGLAALALLYAAVLLVTRLPLFPLREVRISGALAHVTRAQVQEIVRDKLAGNFFTLDLARTRNTFEKLPWVRTAEVRRYWPDVVEVAIEEHVPLARWGSHGLVNTQGEVFEANVDAKLPMFIGPPGSAKEIAIQYAYFHKTLEPIRQAPLQVQVSLRRAWQLRLDSGLTLELGREHVENRLSKFVTVYDRTIGQLNRRLDYVDLRYANGFAVRVPELSKPETKVRG